MASAVQTFKKNGKLREAAKLHNVPVSTLKDRLAGKKSKNEVSRTVLSASDESRLAQWITECARRGYGRTTTEVRKEVQKILSGRKQKTPFKDNLPGRAWVEGFLRRNPEIARGTPQGLVNQRASVAVDKIKNWFLVAEAEISAVGGDVLRHPSRIFNCDETGFALVDGGFTKILASRQDRDTHAVMTDTHGQITVLATACATGQMLKPMIIFPGIRFSYNPLEGFDDSHFGRSDNGWIDSTIFSKWLLTVFVPETEHLPKPVVLFADRHTTHTTLTVSEICRDHNIILYQLPSHSSHIVQPLDLAVFRALKHSWSEALAEYRNESLDVVSERNFASILKKAWDRGIKPDVVASGFRAAGIFPWDPDHFDKTKTAPSRATQAQTAPSGATQAQTDTVTDLTHTDTVTVTDLMHTDTVTNLTHTDTVIDQTHTDTITVTDMTHTDTMTVTDLTQTAKGMVTDPSQSQTDTGTELTQAEPLTDCSTWAPTSNTRQVVSFISPTVHMPAAMWDTDPGRDYDTSSSPTYHSALPPFPVSSPVPSSRGVIDHGPVSFPSTSFSSVVLPAVNSTSPSPRVIPHGASSPPILASTSSMSLLEAFERILEVTANAGIEGLLTYRAQYSLETKTNDPRELLYRRLYNRLRTHLTTDSTAGQKQKDKRHTFDNVTLPSLQKTQTKGTMRQPPKMVGPEAFRHYIKDTADKKKNELEAKEMRKKEREDMRKKLKVEKKKKTEEKKVQREEDRKRKRGEKENSKNEKKMMNGKRLKKGESGGDGKKSKKRTVTFDKDADNERLTSSKCVDNNDTDIDMTALISDDIVCSMCVEEKDDVLRDWIGCDCGKWFHVGCVHVLDDRLRGKTTEDIKGMAYVCNLCE